MKRKLLALAICTLLAFFPILLVPQFTPAQQGQVTLTQTTLSNAVSGPAFYSGTSPTIAQTVFLASLTGISAPVLPGTPVSIIYVDREAMGVLAVNTSISAVTVFRGYLGTQASPHVAGQMVLVSNLYTTNLAVGANIVPSGFYQNDPPQGATCSSGIPTLPWINVLTGAQWLCSTITNTWVPGWNNPLAPASAGQTATVPAAAGTITPSGPLFVVSGAGAITGFNTATGAMTGFNSTANGYGCFTIIAAAGSTWTWTAAGNIMTAGTAATNPGSTFQFCWSSSLSKFVPSRLA